MKSKMIWTTMLVLIMRDLTTTGQIIMSKMLKPLWRKITALEKVPAI